MDLRKDRKGMVAIVDALVFVSILSIAAIGLFAYPDVQTAEVPQAESVANDLFSMELRACDICDIDDTEVYPMCILVCSCLIIDDTDKIETFLKDTLDDLIPRYCGYSLTVEYWGCTLCIERPGMNEMSSSYSSEFEIYGLIMNYGLIIY